MLMCPHHALVLFVGINPAGGEIQELLPRPPLGPDRVRPCRYRGMRDNAGVGVLPALL